MTISNEWRKAAAGAMALGSLVGAVATPAVAQQVSQAAPEFDRHQDAVSLTQKEQIEEVGREHSGDNATARDVRSTYHYQGQRMLTESATFGTQTHELESTGQRLEKQADTLGPGHHITYFGSIDVSQSEAGRTVTEQVGNRIQEVRHYGDSYIVEVNDGHGHHMTMEDDANSRTITDGLQIRTFYAHDSVLHRAGTFEFQNATRSYQETLTLDGGRLTWGVERMIPETGGRARLTTSEVFQPSGEGLIYHKDSHQKNPNGSVVDLNQGVEIHGDGSTRVTRGEQSFDEPALVGADR